MGWLGGSDSGARGYSHPSGARDHVTRTLGRGRPPPLGAGARRRRFGSARGGGAGAGEVGAVRRRARAGRGGVGRWGEAGSGRGRTRGCGREAAPLLSIYLGTARWHSLASGGLVVALPGRLGTHVWNESRTAAMCP